MEGREATSQLLDISKLGDVEGFSNGQELIWHSRYKLYKNNLRKNVFPSRPSECFPTRTFEFGCPLSTEAQI